MSVCLVARRPLSGSHFHTTIHHLFTHAGGGGPSDTPPPPTHLADLFPRVSGSHYDIGRQRFTPFRINGNILERSAQLFQKYTNLMQVNVNFTK